MKQKKQNNILFIYYNSIFNWFDVRKVEQPLGFTQAFSNTLGTCPVQSNDWLYTLSNTYPNFVTNIRYNFAVTAYNAVGLESNYSNVVSFTNLVAPSMVKNLRITLIAP